MTQRFLYSAGGSALVLLIVYFVLVVPVQGEVSSLRDDQEKLKKQIESDLNSEDFHGDLDLRRLQQEVGGLEDALTLLKKTLDLRVDPMYVLDADASNRLIKFKSALEETRGRLRKRAASADISIPESFGFPEGAIADADIPSLLRRLDVMAFVLGKSIDAGVAQVASIAPGGMEDEGRKKKEPLILRDPVTAEVQGSFDSVVRMLHGLMLPADFVTLEDVSLESVSAEGDRLKVGAVVVGLEVRPEAELEVKPGGTRSTDRGGRPSILGR